MNKSQSQYIEEQFSTDALEEIQQKLKSCQKAIFQYSKQQSKEQATLLTLAMNELIDNIKKFQKDSAGIYWYDKISFKKKEDESNKQSQIIDMNSQLESQKEESKQVHQQTVEEKNYQAIQCIKKYLKVDHFNDNFSTLEDIYLFKNYCIEQEIESFQQYSSNEASQLMMISQKFNQLMNNKLFNQDQDKTLVFEYLNVRVEAFISKQEELINNLTSLKNTQESSQQICSASFQAILNLRTKLKEPKVLKQTVSNQSSVDKYSLEEKQKVISALQNNQIQFTISHSREYKEYKVSKIIKGKQNIYVNSGDNVMDVLNGDLSLKKNIQVEQGYNLTDATEVDDKYLICSFCEFLYLFDLKNDFKQVNSLKAKEYIFCICQIKLGEILLLSEWYGHLEIVETSSFKILKQYQIQNGRWIYDIKQTQSDSNKFAFATSGGFIFVSIQFKNASTIEVTEDANEEYLTEKSISSIIEYEPNKFAAAINNEQIEYIALINKSSGLIIKVNHPSGNVQRAGQLKMIPELEGYVFARDVNYLTLVDTKSNKAFILAQIESSGNYFNQFDFAFDDLKKELNIYLIENILRQYKIIKLKYSEIFIEVLKQIKGTLQQENQIN